jgi:hypothetical protein
MVLSGCDFHPSWQQVSWLNQETGETGDVKLVHEAGAAEQFYKQFPAGTRMGMEATGNCQWFLELLAKLGHEVWIGDAAKIRASDARQQKHDKRDARLLLQLLAENRFPRIWVPSREQKDLRQLLIHRHKLVRIRVQVTVSMAGETIFSFTPKTDSSRESWSFGPQPLRHHAMLHSSATEKCLLTTPSNLSRGTQLQKLISTSKAKLGDLAVC